MTDALEDAVELMRALGSGPRLRIVCSLLDGPQSVSEICERLDLAQSGVSQHLARLRAQGLVVASRRGQFVDYALPRTVSREVIAFIDQRFRVRAGEGAGPAGPVGNGRTRIGRDSRTASPLPV